MTRAIRLPFLPIIFLIAIQWAGPGHAAPRDPFEADRGALKKTTAQSFTKKTPPHAALFVDGALLRNHFEAALKAALKDALKKKENFIALPPELGKGIKLRPAIRRTSIAFSDDATCLGCIAVEVKLQGPLGADMGGQVAKLPSGLGYIATARASFEIGIASDKSGRSIRIKAHRQKAWDANVQLTGLPPGVKDELRTLWAGKVKKALREGRIPQITVAHLGPEAPVELVALQARAHPRGLLVAFFFAVAEPGAVKDVPFVKEGFMVALPQKTVRALARTMVLKRGPADGLLLETRDVNLDDDAYRMRVRAWRVDQDGVHRDFDVAGPFKKTSDAKLKAVVRSVEKVEDQALPPDVVGMLTRTQLLEQISDSLNMVVPAQREDQVGEARYKTEATRILADDGVLYIEGRVRRVRPGGP
jgi:hypothetical protein